MRHIALITTSYPDSVPGTEAAGSFVADFARELSQHVRVSVVAAGSADSVAGDDRLRVRRFRVPRLPLSLLSPRRPADWMPILASLRAGRDALDSLIKDDRPDHVFALWALPGGHWADQVARDHGVPFSVWALGSDIWSLGRVPIVRQKLRGVLRRAERRYADGIELAAAVEAIAGLDCGFLPSARSLPAPVQRRRPNESPYRLAFLGRWHANKGIDLLLDALGGLAEADWSRIAEIRIFGGGPLERVVESAVASFIADERPVTLGGYLGKQAAADLIGWADYLLLPSRIESIPVIFSDAVQLGTPLVATPVGDLPRIHERRRFGILADAASPSAYGGAIRAALCADATSFGAELELAKQEFELTEIVKRFVAEVAG